MAATFGCAAALALGLVTAFAAHLGPQAEPPHTEIVVPGIAHDPPTPTPTPPPPRLRPLERCYAPRPADPGFTLFPAAPNSLFNSCQFVTYYGYPGTAALGVLGEFASDAELVAQLRSIAAAYDAVNGFRHAIGGFHIIAAVAQASPMADGTYLARIAPETIEHYIALAETYDMVVFLDVQMGHSTVDRELAPLLPYLANPRVQLALDPEWATPPGVAPGAVIGGMDASAINRAQEILQGVARANGLPSKMLVVHQFIASMIRDKSDLQDYPDVDLLVMMDGFGGREIKLNHYLAYAADGLSDHGGMKLFIDEDVNIFQPADIAAIDPQPDYVTYQ